MKSKVLLMTIGLASFCVIATLGQGQAPAPAPAAPAAAAAPLQQGPGVQSANDARYREFVNSKCKNPPQPRGGGAGGGAPRGGGAAPPAVPAAPMHREYKVTEIPGVIAAGQQWKTIWTGRGNNADGPVAAVNKQKNWPMRQIRRGATGKAIGELSKMSQIKKAAEVAMLFDGIRTLDGISTRINARHNNKRTTNFLFADGHCESIPTENTPDLTEAQWTGTDLTVFNRWPIPKWRLDQN